MKSGLDFFYNFMLSAMSERVPVSAPVLDPLLPSGSGISPAMTLMTTEPIGTDSLPFPCVSVPPHPPLSEAPPNPPPFSSFPGPFVPNSVQRLVLPTPTVGPHPTLPSRPGPDSIPSRAHPCCPLFVPPSLPPLFPSFPPLGPHPFRALPLPLFPLPPQPTARISRTFLFN